MRTADLLENRNCSQRFSWLIPRTSNIVWQKSWYKMVNRWRGFRFKHHFAKLVPKMWYEHVQFIYARACWICTAICEMNKTIRRSPRCFIIGYISLLITITSETVCYTLLNRICLRHSVINMIMGNWLALLTINHATPYDSIRTLCN